MKWYEILLLIAVFICNIILFYQVYKIVEIDAESRGLKHPKLWGLFSTGGSNKGGLLLYLIYRKKYISNMAKNDKVILEKRKKSALYTLVSLFILGGILLIIVVLNY